MGTFNTFDSKCRAQSGKISLTCDQAFFLIKKKNKNKKKERLITGKDFTNHYAGEGLAYRPHEPGEINCLPIAKTELFITALHNGGI